MLVSVIIPTYNRGKYIKRALDSVLMQSYQNFEIIIVDDGSIDGTKQVLEGYLKDPRIFYIYQQNQKVSKARNNGIKQSKGEYIALLDSDDYWLDAKKLQKQVDFFQKNPDYLLTSGGIVRTTESGKEISKILNPETDYQIRQSMLFSSLFVPSGVMFKKDIFKKIGGFDETLEVCEDYDLWLRFGRLGKLYNFQEYFTCYQESGKSLSHVYYRKSLKYNIELVKKYRNDYPFFKKAIALRFCYYAYSFLPHHKTSTPLFSKIKKMVFGKPSYYRG